MDQNRVPSSSPLQQHHADTCGCPPSSSSGDTAPPPSSSSVPRPSSSHKHQHSVPLQSPSNPQKTPLAWGKETIPENGPIPWATNSSAWPEADTENAGQPVASSSRLPSTHFSFDADIDMDPSNAGPGAPDTDADSPFLDPPGSALLTSEPLNRSSSTVPSPPIFLPSALPSPCPMIRTHAPKADGSRDVLPTFTVASVSGSGPSSGKRRERASSLPSADPVFKRRRFTAEVPTPSEEWVRTFATRRRDPTKLAVQQARAHALGEKLLAGRPLRGGCRAGDQIIVASRQPPINLKTLRSLDAHEILKQPQLRHDLLFDTLAFRPINTGSSTADTYSTSSTSEAEASGSADGNPMGTVADMYWESIEAEITTGCRCTRWQVPAKPAMGSQSLKGKEKMAECVCGKWREDLSEDDWWAFQRSRMWSSRLPELIRTLREILITLMGSTTPCANHFAHSFSREALDAHELTCPTVTHALVPQLYEALDPEFLTRRVRRKAFDLSLFQILGEAMKVHCAPVRDALVDDMVRSATASNGKGGVALGLRKCFDCVEIMKLDIANHQVHALRPYLWSCAPQYELTAFHNHLAATFTPLHSSSTREWVRWASLRVASRTPPRERLHLLGHCPCKIGDSTELVLRSVADGFTALVFGDSTWMRVQGSVVHNANKQERFVIDQMPDSLRMDLRRINTFHTEAVDLTITHLLVLACRDLLVSTHRSLSPKEIQAHLESITSALPLLIASYPIWTGTVPTPGNPDFALQLASRIVRLNRPTSFPYDAAFALSAQARETAIADTLVRYIETHLRSDSVVFKHSFKRLEEISRVMLTHKLLKLEPELSVSGVATDFASCGGIVLDDDDDDDDNEGENPVGGDDGPCHAEALVPREESRSTSPTGLGPALTSAVADAVCGVTDPPFEAPPKLTTRALVRARAKRETQRAEENRLARLYGLEPVLTDVKAFVGRLERIAGFNVGVFRDIYAEQGMVVGA